MLKVLFLGTPEFAVPTLEALHQKFEVVHVITQPDRPSGRGLALKAPPVKTKALSLGLPVTQYEKILPEHYSFLKSLGADVGVVVAFGQILKKELIEMPRMGLVNLHSSLLPRWRGAAPIHWAMLAGDPETGVTTMRIVQKLDAGNILKQERTLISPQDTIQTLHDRLAQMGAPLMVQTILNLHQGTQTETVQDESLVTYAKKIDKEMERLDCNEEVLQLDRKIRALNPWPGTSVLLKTGERLKVREAKPHVKIKTQIGTIAEQSGMVLLGVNGGSLELLKVQMDGKPVMDISAFVNGLKGQERSFPIEVQI